MGPRGLLAPRARIAPFTPRSLFSPRARFAPRSLFEAPAAFALLALSALVLGACAAREPRLTTEGRAWVPLHPRTHEPAVAALVLEHGMSMAGETESERHPLAVAVWADGTLISSAAGPG